MSFSHFSMGFYNTNSNNRSTPNLARYFEGLHQIFSTPGVPQPGFPLPHTSSYISLQGSMSPRITEAEGNMEEVSTTASDDRLSAPSLYDDGSSREIPNCTMNGSRGVSGFQSSVNSVRSNVMNPLGNASGYEPPPLPVHHHPPSSIRWLLNADQQSDAPQDPAEGQDDFQGPNYSPSRTPPSTPGTSEFSSSTFRSDSQHSQATERYHIVVDVYYICLDASSNYIRSLRATSQHRRNRNHRYSPYGNHSPRESSPTDQFLIRDPTLIGNISVISNHLWRRARHSIMAPHRAEADVLQVMCRLYAWGEIIIQAMESRKVCENDDEREAGSAATEVEGTIEAAEAAKDFCSWMGDDAASRGCDEALMRLRELEGEGRESGPGSLDGFH